MKLVAFFLVFLALVPCDLLAAQSGSQTIRQAVKKEIENRHAALRKKTPDTQKFFTMVDNLCAMIATEANKVGRLSIRKVENLNSKLRVISKDYVTHLRLCLERAITSEHHKNSYVFARMYRSRDRGKSSEWAAMWAASALDAGLGVAKSTPRAREYLEIQMKFATDRSALERFAKTLID